MTFCYNTFQPFTVILVVWICALKNLVDFFLGEKKHRDLFITFFELGVFEPFCSDQKCNFQDSEGNIKEIVIDLLFKICVLDSLVSGGLK